MKLLPLHNASLCKHPPPLYIVLGMKPLLLIKQFQSVGKNSQSKHLGRTHQGGPWREGERQGGERRFRRGANKTTETQEHSYHGSPVPKRSTATYLIKRRQL